MPYPVLINLARAAYGLAEGLPMRGDAWVVVEVT